eukprot:Gb_33059 [translate_table: standard]
MYDLEMWNHAECILKQRGQFRTVDDVEGVDTLRSEDQEKINKYLEDLDDGSVSAIYANTVIDGIAESSIEKSKTSRATCKSCNQKIAKGEVRFPCLCAADIVIANREMPMEHAIVSCKHNGTGVSFINTDIHMMDIIACGYA